MKALIPLIVVLAVIGSLIYLGIGGPVTEGGDGDGTGVPDGPQGNDHESGIVIEHLGIAFGSWEPEIGRAGDFLFEKQDFVNGKVFLEFGSIVTNDQGEKILTEFSYYLPEGTEIRAVSGGRVTDVGIIGHSQDYYVAIATSENTDWIVYHEHLINLQVQKGDQIEAGQILGEVSPFMPGVEGFGFTEFSVKRGAAAQEDILAICPFTVVDDSLKPGFEAALLELVRDWESFTGEDVYDEGAWVQPGCLIDQVTEGEALANWNPEAGI